MPFIRAFYTIFDNDEKRIGLAKIADATTERLNLRYMKNPFCSVETEDFEY